MKENIPSTNFINTDNEILNVNTNHNKVNIINPNNVNKGRKPKKKASTKRNTKPVIREPEFDKTPDTNEIIEIKEIEEDDFAESDINIRNIIDSILFSQLSEIKVFLLDFHENMSKKFYKSEQKLLPKIHFAEINLLHQGINISKFKQYGFGIYLFFLYLICLLLTFGVLMIFALYYIYRIFYKYYQDLDVECSPLFECDILSLASGVQIIKFRHYYIEEHGKQAFLYYYKNFDVIYKEYIIIGVICFVIAFLINFSYILYSMKVYREYKKENPEINRYTLIISGKDLPRVNNEKTKDYDEKEMDTLKKYIKTHIEELRDVENVDINFTLKLSDYYENMEKLMKKRNKKIKIQHRIKQKRCLCCCWEINKLRKKEQKQDDKILILKNKLIEIKKQNKQYNQLYLLTFENKEDYDKIYSKYPHSYLKESIKGICKKKEKNIYINKAPNPVDIEWKNLEFDNEYNYFKNKFKNLGFSCLYILVPFGVQLLVDYLTRLIKIKVIEFLVNIVISIGLKFVDDWFGDFIKDKLANNIKIWSSSDIEFYTTLYQSIFNFINQGICPLLSYLILDRILEDDNDFSSLVQKMFVIIEMDGFGYPLIDLIYGGFILKLWDAYKLQEEIIKPENIDKKLDEQINNKKDMTRLEFEQSLEKKEMELGDKYSEVLTIYWITMFYLPIYPIGIIQSFLNLLFKFVMEKNFLINFYKRPEYIKPDFGFLCFNFFNFGFFLFLCGNIIFFRNEDNKSSFGVVYIIIMLLFLILPFYLLAKLIIYCYYKNEKIDNENLNDIKSKIKSDYRIFNPCYQREEIKNLFFEFRDKNTLEESQYEEIKKKIDELNDLDLYELQKNLKIPKTFTFSIRKIKSMDIYNDSIDIEEEKINEEKNKLYNLLMRFSFLSYLEEENILNPKKMKFEFIKDLDDRSLSLKKLAIQENLSICDSSYFTTFYEGDKLKLAFVDNERNTKLFDVFERRSQGEIVDKPLMKIACIDSFQIEVDKKEKTDSVQIEEDKNKKADSAQIEEDKNKKTAKIEVYKEKKNYVVVISFENQMIITDVSNKKKGESKTIGNIGNRFEKYKNDKNATNIFSLSTVKHGNNNMWIITSYYYDQMFKIYEFSSDSIKLIKAANFNEYIISLEAAFLTEENSYICVRSTKNGKDEGINLFINNILIKNLLSENEFYINFKIEKYNNCSYVIISKIKHDLSKYYIVMINLYPLLPLYIKIFKGIYKLGNEKVLGWLQKFKLEPGEWKNNDAHIPMTSELAAKINVNIPQEVEKTTFSFDLTASESQREAMKKFYKTNNIEKFNLGSVQLWENDFILFVTPFGSIDFIDILKKDNNKIGSMNNNIKDNDKNEEKNEGTLIYNISKMIEDPQYGSTFILRDNKGKIQYIRSCILKDKINFSIKQSDEYFNNRKDDEKLEHIYFSYRFYFYYTIVSLVAPLISGFVGHSDNDDTETDKELITDAIIFYAIYACCGFWLKGLVYDIGDTSHTQRICTKRTIYICLVLKVLASSILSWSLCKANKSGIVFIVMLVLIYCIQLAFNYVVYIFKIKFLLRTFWLAFIFYQISRLCILLFFIFSVWAGVDHIETYIYAAILCVVSAYMFMANYFNTLMKDITYNNYLQAIFNYPMEWMNLFCCWWVKPIDLIMVLDYAFCCCDSCFLVIGEWLFTLIMIMIYIIFYMFYLICVCFGCA